ncbi:cytochrome P450 3A29 [Bombina bombina]|uniref:cytochrome P450 3A29 n=1 Tax=Bombina bombina TaxID=8345 RepID=UPI00235ABAC2|nr:cytochrome P450 3A29 [Bombina bombina]
MTLLPVFSAETWTLLILFVTLLVLYGIWPYRFFKQYGIPGPKPLPFIGTFHENKKGLMQFDTECFNKYGKIWGLYDGRQPVLAVMDPMIIKAVLVKECFTLFTNRRTFGLNGPLKNAITVAEDDQWKRIRTVLSPTFSSGKLKQMFPIIKHYAELLVQNVQKKIDKSEKLIMKDIFGAYSIDVILSTSFSVNIDSMNNPTDLFVVNAKKLFSFTFLNPLLILTVLFPFLTPILEAFNVSLVPADIMNFFKDAVLKIKEGRKSGSPNERVDLLQLMVDSQTTEAEIDGYKVLTDTEIMAQSLVFLLAGYETTSTALMFLAYNLATHPDVQNKVQEEIETLLPNKAPPTYNAVMQMEYLEMVVNESLRLYPAAGRIERVCKKTTEINGVTIPSGVVTMIPVYVLHRNPEIWPEPEEFRPERFSTENKDTYDPYTFLPFGAGPRNCIGMRFALINIKVAITLLLQNFTFQTCEETPVPMELDTQGFLKSKQPIILKLVPKAPTQK